MRGLSCSENPENQSSVFPTSFPLSELSEGGSEGPAEAHLGGITGAKLVHALFGIGILRGRCALTLPGDRDTIGIG